MKTRRHSKMTCWFESSRPDVPGSLALGKEGETELISAMSNETANVIFRTMGIDRHLHLNFNHTFYSPTDKAH
jgi:hypothetical protein